MIEFFWGYVKFVISAYFTVRILKFLFILYKSFYIHCVRKEEDLSDLKDMWTVATGGTDGIGRAYINELAASRGMRKFFLLGRNEQKLSNVKKEMEEKYPGCEVRYSIFDFEKDSLSTLPEELKTMEVGILLNCAGISPSLIGNFVELPNGTASKILQVNLMSNIKMLELVFPGMVKRDKGVVINVASMTGWRPFPYLSTYPSSKAAISFFSESMSDEFAGSNVKIQCLVPLLVATKVAAYEKEEANNLFVVSTENFAKQAVHVIGMHHLATGCWQHDVQIAFGTLISAWLFKKIFVPTVMLGVHKQRVADYHGKNKDQ